VEDIKNDEMPKATLRDARERFSNNEIEEVIVPTVRIWPSLAAATIKFASRPVSAIGFSRKTWQPAFSAVRASEP
jgi:hypothetical protein